MELLLVEAFRIGWREAVYRMIDARFDPSIPEPSEHDIRRLLGLQEPPARCPEPHELSELSIG